MPNTNTDATSETPDNHYQAILAVEDEFLRFLSQCPINLRAIVPGLDIDGAAARASHLLKDQETNPARFDAWATAILSKRLQNVVEVAKRHPPIPPPAPAGERRRGQRRRSAAASSARPAPAKPEQTTKAEA